MKIVVVFAAALLRGFNPVYHVGEEAKIKLRKGYQLAQDHTASQWTN